LSGTHGPDTRSEYEFDVRAGYWEYRRVSVLLIVFVFGSLVLTGGAALSFAIETEAVGSNAGQATFRGEKS
jgi:hypothetical protein